jgi:hypothetical protein
MPLAIVPPTNETSGVLARRIRFAAAAPMPQQAGIGLRSSQSIDQPSLGSPDDVRRVLDELGIASLRGIVINRAARQRRTGPPQASMTSFVGHSLGFPSLGFRELSCYDDQAQVDHEEGADLRTRKAICWFFAEVALNCRPRE